MNATCRRTAGWFAALLLCLSACPTSGLAADDSEALTRRARNSGGLQGGAWQVADLSAAPGGTDSHTASIEGWFQKGLDLHLAIETTLGFWQRTQTVTQSGTLGTQSQTEMQSYFVPTLTTLKLYPATLPSAPTRRQCQCSHSATTTRRIRRTIRRARGRDFTTVSDGSCRSR